MTKDMPTHIHEDDDNQLTRFVREQIWRDINTNIAASLHYDWIDKWAIRFAWWHGLFLFVVVWLNQYVHISEYWPSPLGRHLLSPALAASIVAASALLCLIVTYFYVRFREQSHYMWRVAVCLVLGAYSCLLVLASGGSTLIHFHFLLVMAFVALYADWRLIWWVFVLANAFLLAFSALRPTWIYYNGYSPMATPFDAIFMLMMVLVLTVLCQKYRETVVALQEAKRRNDEFLAIASHELKTPLTSVKGYTQVLQQRLKRHSDPVSLEYVSKIYHQLNRLIGLVRDLLDVSKIQSGKMEFRQERVGVDGLVREVVDEVQALSPHHAIKVEGRAYSPILGDRGRLYQVLLNLLMNAVKYSPGKEEILVKVVEARDKLVISVQDFGIGISMADQRRIFEPYFRATDVRRDELPGGLGMGLYICSEIIQLHQGKMWVDSEPGKGSTFSFYLPLSKLQSGAL